MGIRARCGSLAVVLAGLLAGGCGSSASPSALDPAQLAPTRSALYVELTVRPQGSAQSDAESGLTKLIGHSPDASIQRGVGRLFHQSGLNYSQDVQPWLGQRIGIVFTTFSKSGLGLILPTNDSSAALRTLKRAEKNASLTSTSYRGVPYQQGVENGSPVALGIVDRSYAVVAAPAVFDAIVDASDGAGLRSQPGFLSTLDALPTGSLVRSYVNGPAVVSAIGALPSTSPATRQRLGAMLARGQVPSSITAALSVTSKQLGIEIRASASSLLSHRSTADVSGLPGQSWLALSTGTGASKTLASGLTSSFTNSFNSSALARGLSPSTLLNALQQRIGINIRRDLLPALGGFQLAMQGTSVATLGAGLVLHPSDPQAALRLLSDIHALVSRSHSLTVTGGPRSFTITRGLLPIPKVVVQYLGRKVLATFDEPSIQTMLAPASTLATNPTLGRARSQLVPGSEVPLFIDFGALGALARSLPGFSSSASNAKALKVIGRLDYLVFGFNPVVRDAQLVLGLR